MRRTILFLSIAAVVALLAAPDVGATATGRRDGAQQLIVTGARGGPSAYPEWSDGSTDITPVGSRVFLGQFGTEVVSLSLSGLPVHTEATITFDLFVIQSWDGNFRAYGPDVFDLSATGARRLLHTTFANPDTELTQAYPDAFPGGRHPAGTGAAEVNTLGYAFSGDSVYHLTSTFPHTDAAVRFDFSARLSESLPDESWGLDDVEVAVDGEVVYTLNEPEAVLTSRAGEAWAFANDRYIAYTRWTPKAGQVALARLISDGTTTRLNRQGTQATTGGFDPGTNVVLYDQWKAGKSALWFYDLDTGERTKVPDVNSPEREWFPRISSTFIAFQRSHEAEGASYVDLLVYDRASGETRTIGTWKQRPKIAVWLDFVGDRYLTYMLEDAEGQNVYLYDLETDTQESIPKPENKNQVVAVVDEVNSTIYVGRETRPCGRNAAMWRLPIDLTDEPTKVLQFTDGISPGRTASLTPNAGTRQTDLYVEFYDCQQGDVFLAPAVDSIPANIARGKPAVASGIGPDSPPSMAVDGGYETLWNSGDYAPQWIEIDLGGPRSIERISLLTAQLPDGDTVHRVLGKATVGAPYVMLHEFAGFTADDQRLDYSPPTPWENVRYVRVETTVSPSWVAWREIEVYSTT